MKKIYCLLVLFLIIVSCKNSIDPELVTVTLESSARLSVPRVVILGSSTASGYGASTYSSSWAGQFKAYYGVRSSI